MMNAAKLFSTCPDVSPLLALSPTAASGASPAPASDATGRIAPVEENQPDDDDDANNDTLRRLLNEVTLAVTEEEDDELAAQPSAPSRGGKHVGGDPSSGVASHGGMVPPPRSAGGHAIHTANANGDDDDHVAFPPPFSVSGAGLAGEHFPAAAAAPSGGGGGGFIVEGSAPPPPPPPMYGTPSLTGTPFSCYSGIPSTAVNATNKAPPSFAEAMASATPLSLHPRTPIEMTPLTAHYVPPGPSAVPDPILLRNTNGVFLLNPVVGSTKPTPPYTPPTGNATPPISPLPRYSLPPAQGQLPLPPPISGGPNGFLGATVAQSQQQQHARTRSGSFAGPGMAKNASGANAHADALPPPPQYGASPFLGYTQSITSVRGTPSFGAAPPPYSA